MPQVVAKFQFYLRATIEVEGDATHPPAVFHIDDYEIAVYPPARMVAAEPTWEADPDVAHGSINGVPLWWADTAVLEVRGSIKSDVVTEVEHYTFLRIAEEALCRFLRMTRFRTHRTNIEWRSEKLYEDHHAKYLDQKGATVPIWTGGSGIGTVTSEMIFGGQLNRDIWDSIRTDLSSGTEPELWEELLVDAQGAAWVYPTKAIIDAGAACEVFIERFSEEARKANNKDAKVYGALVEKRRWPEYFDVVLKYVLDHSLKDEKQGLYSDIERLYKTANSVRHEGRCGYKEGSTFIEVGPGEAARLVSAASDTIQWVKSLPSLIV